jgi:hypothetical protein
MTEFKSAIGYDPESTLEQITDSILEIAENEFNFNQKDFGILYKRLQGVIRKKGNTRKFRLRCFKMIINEMLNMDFLPYS